MTLLAALVTIVVAGMAWVRFAPSDPGRWHVDPMAASRGEGRFLVRPEGGDATFEPRSTSPQKLLELLDDIAMQTPRTSRLAGSAESGRITWITRSRVFGFPDYTTAQAIVTPQGTTLTLFARLRFGRGDMGVNRARVEGWLAALDRRLG